MACLPVSVWEKSSNNLELRGETGSACSPRRHLPCFGCVFRYQMQILALGAQGCPREAGYSKLITAQPAAATREGHMPSQDRVLHHSPLHAHGSLRAEWAQNQMFYVSLQHRWHAMSRVTSHQDTQWLGSQRWDQGTPGLSGDSLYII